MASKLKRLTFVVTPEMEPLLDGIKKEMFYNCSQSEMIRTLIEEGWNAIKNGNQHNPDKTTDINIHKKQGKNATGTLFRKVGR